MTLAKPDTANDLRRRILEALDDLIDALSNPEHPVIDVDIPKRVAANPLDNKLSPDTPGIPASDEGSDTDYKIVGALRPDRGEQTAAYESHSIPGSSGDSGEGKQIRHLRASADNRVRALREHDPDRLRDEYEERAAIKQYDAGLSRTEAEEEASNECTKPASDDD